MTALTAIMNSVRCIRFSIAKVGTSMIYFLKNRWHVLTEERKKMGFDVKVQFGVRDSYIEATSNEKPSVSCELFSDGTLQDSFFRLNQNVR